jgi:hypothetical protein
MTALTRLNLAQLHSTLLGGGDFLSQRAPTRGRPRAEMRVPVTLEAGVEDTRLFGDAVNPVRRFWPPRYALATEETSGGPHDRARLAAGEWKTDSTARLFVGLS